MKITENVRKYAAEQGIAEEEALKRGVAEKSRERIREEGKRGLREGVNGSTGDAPVVFGDSPDTMTNNRS